MIVFPNCKINLGLNILRKRNDGYHDLETIFYPVPLTDALEIIENKQPGKTPVLPFTSSGLPIAGKPASNLCVKAYRLLKKDFPGLPAVLIHLHKIIPSGAGLGGGSSDPRRDGRPPAPTPCTIRVRHRGSSTDPPSCRSGIVADPHPTRGPAHLGPRPDLAGRPSRHGRHLSLIHI
mgnify:CR=1 FL=1